MTCRLPRRSLAALLGTLAFGLAGGCASAPPPPPAPVEVTIALAADGTINPDLDGRPSPLAVRVYLLTGPEAIADADLLALWEAESATLAGTLVERREFVLAPGGSAGAQLTIPDRVSTLAVVAAFRNYRDATWRVVLPVDAGGSAPERHLALTLAVSGQSLRAELRPASPAGAKDS